MGAQEGGKGSVGGLGKQQKEGTQNMSPLLLFALWRLELGQQRWALGGLLAHASFVYCLVLSFSFVILACRSLG